MLAEAVRFELTDDFSSTVFKTVAISRTLPRFHYKVLYYKLTQKSTIVFGTKGWTRTSHTLCFKQVLYQMSYLGIILLK